MELSVLFFLTSGLFLGWALGANDAANVFGTAVGPDTAVGGAGIGSGMADGAASTGATVEAAGAASASIG